MNNLILNNLKGEEVLINWDNVTHVTKPENYLLGQIGDLGNCIQINFTNKRSVHVKEDINQIKNKLK
tara:strand:- start:723 stop:923 length:201 start_codon:yes stop_codon:yes gene_type:complete